MKQLLTRISLGRVLLHSACICRGGQWRFHFAGIRRELGAILRSN